MDKPLCELCGEPMPEGESMFKFHGYSGNCPKPPLPKKTKECPTCKGTGQVAQDDKKESNDV